MPIIRDANGRFKSKNRPTNLKPTTPKTTFYTSGSMVQYSYTKAKTDFHDYRPVIAKVSDAGIISIHSLDNTDEYQKYIGAHVFVFNTTAVKDKVTYVDLKTLPDNAWDDTINNWNQLACKDELPHLRSFINMLGSNAHPLVNGIYLAANTFKYYTGIYDLVYNYYLWIRELHHKRIPNMPNGWHDRFFKVVSQSKSIISSDNYTREGGFRFCYGSGEEIHLNEKEFTNLLDLAKWYNSVTGILYMSELSSYLTSVLRNPSITKDKITAHSMLEVPKIAKDEQLKYILKGKDQEISHHGYCISLPMLSEFEEPGEMFDIVKQHLGRVPELEITYLRKRHVIYYGGLGHPDGLNYDVLKDPRYENVLCPYLSKDESLTGLPASINLKKSDLDNTRLLSEQAILYIGEAWMVYFKIEGKDILGGNKLYFITPEQYAACYANHPLHGNKYMKDENGKPIALPDLIYLAQNSWCERANGAFSDDTTDFQTPYHRRMPLYVWVLSNLLAKTGVKLQNVGVPVVSHLDKLNKLSAFVDNSLITNITQGLGEISLDTIESIRNGVMPVVETVNETVNELNTWTIDPRYVIDMNQTGPRQPVVTSNSNEPVPITDDSLTAVRLTFNSSDEDVTDDEELDEDETFDDEELDEDEI